MLDVPHLSYHCEDYVTCTHTGEHAVYTKSTEQRVFVSPSQQRFRKKAKADKNETGARKPESDREKMIVRVQTLTGPECDLLSKTNYLTNFKKLSLQVQI